MQLTAYLSMPAGRSRPELSDSVGRLYRKLLLACRRCRFERTTMMKAWEMLATKRSSDEFGDAGVHYDVTYVPCIGVVDDHNDDVTEE